MNIFDRGSKTIEEKIYLNDLPLENGLDDKFQAIQIGEILKQSIEQSTLPLHISLLGKWGSGKTTVIKMLESLLDKSEYELKVISVWKFADDAPSLHRKIVREIEIQLKQENPENLDVSTTFEEQFRSNGVISNLLLLRRLGNYKYIILFGTLIYLALLLIQFLIPLIYKDLVNNIVLIGILGLITILLSRNSYSLFTAIKNVRSNLPLNHGDQYENRFRNVVNEYLGKSTKKKLILVFDDLDRLPPKQLYGALNTVKTFLDSNRCAFIIPCDEEVLKKELADAFEKKNMEQFDVKEYLNKTFDLTVRLPKLEQANMRKYALSLLEKNNILWYKENSRIYHEILTILIHSDVLTPRHVKKNINGFATDWELAKRRDNVNKSGNFLTLHPVELAIFVVLKSDFSEFYNIMMENPYIIWDLIDEKDGIEVQLSELNNINSLKGFLSRVEPVLPTDPRPFIYFNNQELNPLTGRIELEKIKKYILNGQINEFEESIEEIDKSELEFVFNSVLIDLSSSLDCKNVFSIIFSYPEVVDVLREDDKIKLQDIIRNNLNIVIEYNLNNILNIFEKVIRHSSVWSLLGGLIYNQEEKYFELFNASIKYPALVNKLQIKDINNLFTNHSSLIGFQANDTYFVPKSLFNLPFEHVMVQEIDWYASLNNCFSQIAKLKDIEDAEAYQEEVERLKLNFKLSEWVLSVNEKTNQIIECKGFNLLIKKYKFIDTNSLEGIIPVWINLFNDSPQPENLISFFKVIKNNLLILAKNNGDLDLLGREISNFNGNEELSKEIYSFLETRKDIKNKELFMRILQGFRNVDAVARFSLESFAFETDEINEVFLEILIRRDKFFDEESKDTLFNAATTHIFNVPNNKSSNNLLKLLIQSETWLKAAIKYRDNWFLSNDLTSWFRWDGSEQNYYDKLEIYYLLYMNETYIWKNLIDCLVRIISNNSYHYNISSYPFASNWRTFLNSVINLFINKCTNEEIWDQVLNDLTSVSLYSNNSIKSSIFDFMDKDMINKVLTHCPNIIALNNEKFNEVLFELADLDNSNHLNHVLSRWNYFSSAHRKELTSNIPKENESLLTSYIERNPELKYISELNDYVLEDNIKQDIMETIVINSSKDAFNQWVLQSIKLFIEQGLNKWRLTAIEFAIQSRNDLVIPNLESINLLFSFKDNRTALAIKLVNNLYSKRNKNKSEIKEIRKNILLLEDNIEFKELVLGAKSKFGWRNNML
ncbi:KAP family NTPase [Bacillus sp. F19]|nr:KAP family NTPase [Bacillus sp. F19]